MSLHYTAEKMYSATYNLATGLGNLRDRLYYAWQACMTLKPDDPADFPTEDLRIRFKALVDEISSRQPPDGDDVIRVGGDGAFKAALDQAPEEDLQRWAGELFDIAYEVAEIYAQSEDD